MHSLEKMFPSLTTFSDLDWDAVTKEYETTSIDISFPEYLQQKALDGDCPSYLFELAFYELAHFDAKTSAEPFPFQPGVYLNPTALFLSLEFDITRMLQEASEGNVSVIERPHVLSLYRDRDDKVHSIELSDEELEVLQHLEDGPKPDKSFLLSGQAADFEQLVKKGLIINLI